MSAIDDPRTDPFEEYVKAADPKKRERGFAWYTAIGLQQVDGLETSDYLKETARRNVEGEISIKRAGELVEAYYKNERKSEAPRTEEADRVAVRIAEILSQPGFSLSPAQYLSIHKRLFEGIYPHAGQLRDYNITKAEWVLDGDTVTYGGFTELAATLEYDISVEKAFSYSGLSMDGIIRHLAVFISRLWQIHVFGEGNTRTTAVFFILYLRSLSFDVTNTIFAENAWYFRNALVRANYNNLRNGVHETTEYLELFLRNLLLGEDDPLKNRTMHISGELKQDFEPAKQDSARTKQDFDRLTRAGLSVRSANNVMKLMALFGFDKPFGRMDIARELDITKSPASELLNKLVSISAVIPVSGHGRGKYRFGSAFFERRIV